MIEKRSSVKGRPRTHDSAAERIAAYRRRHGLAKVTVDIPEGDKGQVQKYAAVLRNLATRWNPPLNQRAEKEVGSYSYRDDYYEFKFSIEPSGITSARWEWSCSIHTKVHGRRNAGPLLEVTGRCGDLKCAKELAHQAAIIWLKSDRRYFYKRT